MINVWVRLLNDHPTEIALLALASAVIGGLLVWLGAHYGYRRRTESMRAEVAQLKEQRERRIGEFVRLTPPDQQKVGPKRSDRPGGTTE